MPVTEPNQAEAGRRLGFSHGFLSLFSAWQTLSRLPAAWPFALVPTIVFALLELAFVALAARYVAPWIETTLGGAGTLRRIGAEAALWLGMALCALLGWILAALLTPILSAPALERIVTLVERELRRPPRAPLGVIAEFWCGARSLLLGSLLTLPIVFALSVLELFVPAASVISTPLKLMVGALGVAWGLFDYPLTLRGRGARARLALLRRHLSTVLGFGLAFALLFWLPCCGIVLLPVGVVAATTLLARIDAGSAPPELR